MIVLLILLLFAYQLQGMQSFLELYESQWSQRSKQKVHISQIPNDVLNEIMIYARINDLIEHSRLKKERLFVQNQIIYKRKKISFVNTHFLGLHLHMSWNNAVSVFTPTGYDHDDQISNLLSGCVEPQLFAINRNSVLYFYDQRASSCCADDAKLIIYDRSNLESKPSFIFPFKQTSQYVPDAFDTKKQTTCGFNNISAIAISSDGKYVAALHEIEAHKAVLKFMDGLGMCIPKIEKQQILFFEKKAETWQKVDALILEPVDQVEDIGFLEGFNQIGLLKKDGVVKYVSLPEQIQLCDVTKTIAQQYLAARGICKSIKQING